MISCPLASRPSAPERMVLAVVIGTVGIIFASLAADGGHHVQAAAARTIPASSEVAADAGVTWYVTTHSGNDLIQYDGSGKFVRQLVGHRSGGLDEPRGFIFAGNDLYMASANKETSSILRYNAQTGAFINVFATGSTLRHPYAIAFSPVNGNLLAANQDNNSIAQFDGQTGKPVGSGYFVPDGAGGLNAPRAMIFGPDNNLYVASRDTNSVLRFNGTTGAAMGALWERAAQD